MYSYVHCGTFFSFSYYSPHSPNFTPNFTLTHISKFRQRLRGACCDTLLKKHVSEENVFFEKVRSFFGLRKGVFLDFFAVMQDFVMRTVRKKCLFLEASVCLFQNTLELFNINVNV